jgi:guanine deaminase
MQVLHGTLLQPRSAENCQVLPNTCVTIADDGKIAQVASVPVGAAAVGGEGCWILPGFIDAHLHMPQWDRRGIDGLSMFQWQEKIGYPAELRMRDAKIARSVAEEFTRGVIANGTTTVAAFGSPFASEVDQTFNVFSKQGLRAIYGMMLNDDAMPAELCQQADAALDESRAMAAKWNNAENGRLMYAFSPRTSVRCSERMMRGAAALATMLKCYLQTHVAESLEELADVRAKFPEHVDEADIFAELGFLTPRTLLAHGLFFDRDQRRIVAQKNSALIHCPTANLFRESGLMDYVAHKAEGIRIALGSSVAGGPDPFMPRVAVESLQTAKAIKVHTLPRRNRMVPSPAEAWWALTRGAAEALSLSDKIGTIEAGKEADVLVVRPEKWIADLPVDQQISALLYTITPQQIEHVYIAGKRVGPN